MTKYQKDIILKIIKQHRAGSTTKEISESMDLPEATIRRLILTHYTLAEHRRKHVVTENDWLTEND